MVNITLLWLMLIPVALSAISYFLLPLMAPRVSTKKDAAVISMICAGASAVIMIVAVYASLATQTSDYEILNGQITSKDRLHDSYVRRYDCNCREVCSGSGEKRSCSQVCETCTEDRYTVTFACGSTIGTFEIDKNDSSSASIYNMPDNARWAQSYVGEPVAKASRYTNYVQAVRGSLFRPAEADLKSKFAAMLPEYPINVYDIYHVDRFISVGISVPNAATWNAKISEMLKTLGPSKQVNVIVVVVKTDDPNYTYALRDYWHGANKNDVVLVIGSTEYPKITWANVISWTDREIFKTMLRDEIVALETINVDTALTVLNRTISTEFSRKRMRDFEYLSAEVDPPQWVVTVAVSIVVLLYMALWFSSWRSQKSLLSGRIGYNLVRKGFRGFNFFKWK